MKIFTYNQYIKCIHTLRLNTTLQVAEESEGYKLESENKRYLRDKLIKDILKEEIRQFINSFVEPQKLIEKNQLFRYTNDYITNKYKSKEADLIYKLKEQEIFFLIEHQSTVDRNIPYRILNYCIDIIQQWCKNKKIRKNTGSPIIVPVVIYTGDKNWNIPTNSKDKQISSYMFEKYIVDLEYNLVDINKLSKQKLLEQNTMFSYTMLIEKSRNKEELIDNLNLIIKTNKDKEQWDKLSSIIQYLLENIPNEDIKQELLEKTNKKVGEEQVSILYDRLLAENKRILKQGKEQKEKEIIKNMINKKLDDEIILEITGINKEELEKIKTFNI